MKPLDPLFQQALHAHQNHELATAKELYLKILHEDPQHAEAMHLLGLLAAQLGQFDVAAQWIEKAIAENPTQSVFHNNLANALKRLGQLDKAIVHYQEAIHLDEQYCDAYNNLGNLFAKQNKFPEAEFNLKKAIAIQPDYIEAHTNLGLLNLKQGKLNEALEAFERLLKLQPNSIIAHWQLANIYLQQNQLEKAQEHYQVLLKLKPDYVEAINNLGVISLKQEKTEEAIEYFKNALSLDEKNKDARNNLAGTFLKLERFTEAIWHYQLYLRLVPDDYQAYYSLGVAYMGAGYFSDAIHQFKKITEVDTKHADAYCNLGAVYLKLGKPEQAIKFYELAAAIQPQNQAIRYMLDALTGKANPTAAPPEYVKNLFDSYANHFDEHLTEQLHYQVPVLMRQALAEHIPNNAQWNILDLGCGSGLSGQELRNIAKHLIGIDISSRMLEKAHAKQIYDELLEADIATKLAEYQNTFDLIVAADTLVYFGDLTPIFRHVQAALHQNGLFAFTLEIGTVRAYQLTSTGRYIHSQVYVEVLAEQFGFKPLTIQKIHGRLQQGEPVDGSLFVYKKIS